MLFRYGSAVTGKFFYDRSDIQKRIGTLLVGGQSFMLKAPRRYGKTSLLKNVLQKKKFDYFYADFRKTPRLELFNNKLLEYLYSKMGIKGALKQLKENAVSFLLTHKTTVKVTLPLFEASVELFGSSDVREDERMVQILDLIEQTAKELDETFYIVLDEFQDVKKLSGVDKLDILEMMRGAMQQHENVCYMFAGSHMTLMTEIFENRKSPFFNFSRKFVLDGFDIDELQKELLKAFKSEGIVFESDELLLRLLDSLKGHPANTMLVMQLLENLVIEEDIKLITDSFIIKAYNEAREEMSDLISEYIKEIKTKEHLHDVIYRMASGEPQVLDSNSLRQKRAYLVDMGYIRRKERGVYEIIDGFLEEELLNI
jgi:AAA+ ATPase superfamily predicted ATPase